MGGRNKIGKGAERPLICNIAVELPTQCFPKIPFWVYALLGFFPYAVKSDRQIEFQIKAQSSFFPSQYLRDA